MPDTVVGAFTQGGVVYGFSETGGVYTTLQDPNAGSRDPFTYAQGIYGNTVVGAYVGGDTYDHGFTETGGVYTTVDDPNATSGTVVYGIYGNTIVGDYIDGTGTHGFTDTGGVFTTVDVPGATATGILGVYGTTIVGEFNTDTGSHGFLATLPSTPEPASFALLAIGVAVLARRRRSAR